MKTTIIALFATIWCISALAQSTISYIFDKQGRLKSEKMENAYQLQFNYDKEGNLFSKTVVSITGLDDMDISSGNRLFKVYPNPTSNYVAIEMLANELSNEIKLYDISGRILEKRVVSDAKTHLSLDKYENGVYFLMIKSGDESTRFKIIKM